MCFRNLRLPPPQLPSPQSHSTKRRKFIPDSVVVQVLNSEEAKRIKDKFRADIAGVIVHHLGPYRKDSCRTGRITNNDDFKHLAKKVKRKRTNFNKENK